MKKFSLVLVLIAWCGLTTLSASNVNRSISVDKGEKIQKSLTTVNGSIRIDDDAIIEGDCRTVNGSVTLADNVRIAGRCDTVNGSITIGNQCRMDGVETTNGRIEIGEKCEIIGDVETTNGRVVIDRGSLIAGNVETTNGNIDLTGVELKKSLFMSNGEIHLQDNTVVSGDLEITPSRDSSSFFFGLFHRDKKQTKAIEIFISKNSVVMGDIIVKNDKRKVIVYIDASSQVKGKIINAEKRIL